MEDTNLTSSTTSNRETCFIGLLGFKQGQGQYDSRIKKRLTEKSAVRNSPLDQFFIDLNFINVAWAVDIVISLHWNERVRIDPVDLE